MFSLLTPFSLWLTAALAVPLAIHFLGRQKLKSQNFPSLLLIREKFSRAMQKHRLKNLLLLIIRTLLLLCLLLALANPTWNALSHKTEKPDLSIVLINNGIYGKMHVDENQTFQDLQLHRIIKYDSANQIQSKIEALILGGGQGDGLGDGLGAGLGRATISSERFGNYSEALLHAFKNVSAQSGITEIQIPVFNWEEIQSAQELLGTALQDHPGLRVTLLNFENAESKLRPFSEVKSIPHQSDPTILLRASWSKAAQKMVERNETRSKNKIIVSANERILFEIDPTDTKNQANIEVTVPLSQSSEIVGKFSIGKEIFAAPDFYFRFPKMDELNLLHTGSTLTSLPSLGRESFNHKITHLASSKGIPWDKKYNVIYLSNEKGAPSEANSEVYSRLLEFVKQGGRLIISVGESSDIPMLNRFLLQPLRLGRLGNLVRTSSSEKLGITQDSRTWLENLSNDLGPLGHAEKRFEFFPDSGNKILIGGGQSNAAILVGQNYYRGRVLLWTTDVDDLTWTDLGVGPVLPLFHHAFENARTDNLSIPFYIASDSVLVWKDEQGAALLPNKTSDINGSYNPKVIDPNGDEFPKVQRLQEQNTVLRIGPFDKLGIYKICRKEKDTTFFAVNLAKRNSNSESSKAELLKTLKPFQSRIKVLSESEISSSESGSEALWPKLIVAAILLLFLEGLIALFFSSKRRRS